MYLRDIYLVFFPHWVTECLLFVQVCLYMFLQIVVSPSKSVRFNQEDEEIRPDTCSVSTVEQVVVQYKPVAEHTLTPCASLAEVISKEPPTSFTETLLLRLLDDLNRGHLSHDDLMTLASYSMDVIQSAATLIGKTSKSVKEDSDQHLVDSSSSMLASRLVDFTLGKILQSIRSGDVHHDDLASLTLSLLDNASGTVSKSSVTLPHLHLDDLVEDVPKVGMTSAIDDRDISPVSDSLLDEFVITTLQDLLHDLKNERIAFEQMKTFATCVSKQAENLASESENTQRKEILEVLQRFLGELKSGTFDSKTVCHIVLNVVQAYDSMTTSIWTTFEHRMSDMIKRIFQIFETKVAASQFSDVSLSVLKEANQKIANHHFDSRQIDQLTQSIFSLNNEPGTIIDGNYGQIVEDTLKDVIHKLENDKTDVRLRHYLQTLAETITADLVDRRSPQLTDTFTDVLTQMKRFLESQEILDDRSLADVNVLISKVAERCLSPDAIFELASSVVHAIESPLKSDSSFVAVSTVTHTLKEVLEDMNRDEMEEKTMEKMIDALRKCNSVAKMRDNTQPSLLIVSLSSLIQTVLGKLAFQLEAGTLETTDVVEIADTLKEKALDTDRIVEGSHVLLYIYHLLKDLEGGEVPVEHVYRLGHALVDCGSKLLAGFQDHGRSELGDIGATIRDIETEIRAGSSSNQLLKNITKEIITSYSNSAIYAVENTRSEIERDDRRSYMIKSEPQNTNDFTNFVCDVLLQLKQALSQTTVSELAVAKFCATILGIPHQSDPVHEESFALENLDKIIEDVENNERSVFADRILQEYLLPNESSGALIDPMKAVESILVAISSTILGDFVKTTLQTVLLEMRENAEAFYTKPTSVYVLRSASAIVAEKLVKKVLSFAKKELKTIMTKSETNKDGFENAISKLLLRWTEQSTTSNIITEVSKSTEIEDIVLETLHNVVSNALFEQATARASRGQPPDTFRDLVLGAIQRIVEDQQDKRVNISLGVTSIGDISGTYERTSAGNKASLEYIGLVIKKVIREMKRQLVENQNVDVDTEESSSAHIQTVIIEHLERGLSVTELPCVSLSSHQREDVKSILMESIKRTIDNIKGHALSPEDLTVLCKTVKTLIADPATSADVNEEASEKQVIELMEDIYTKVQTHELDETVLQNISVQLATLGMECPKSRSLTDVACPSSSIIMGLVTDVITRMAEGLQEELKDMENNNNVEDQCAHEDDGSGRISRSSLPKSALREGACSKTSKVSWVNWVQQAPEKVQPENLPRVESPRKQKQNSRKDKVTCEKNATKSPRPRLLHRALETRTTIKTNTKKHRRQVTEPLKATNRSRQSVRVKSCTPARKSPMCYLDSYLSKTPTPGPGLKPPTKSKRASYKPKARPRSPKWSVVSSDKHPTSPRKSLDRNQCHTESSQKKHLILYGKGSPKSEESGFRKSHKTEVIFRNQRREPV